MIDTCMIAVDAPTKCPVCQTGYKCNTTTFTCQGD